MTPRGEPDPRQLRMETLQAMSEAARRADAAGAPRPPQMGGPFACDCMARQCVK